MSYIQQEHIDALIGNKIVSCMILFGLCFIITYILILFIIFCKCINKLNGGKDFETIENFEF